MILTKIPFALAYLIRKIILGIVIQNNILQEDWHEKNRL